MKGVVDVPKRRLHLAIALEQPFPLSEAERRRVFTHHSPFSRQSAHLSPHYEPPYRHGTVILNAERLAAHLSVTRGKAGREQEGETYPTSTVSPASSGG